MYDDAGRAILHINSLDCPRQYERDVSPGPTGALHHVALNCSGYEEIRARLTRRGLEHRLNEVPPSASSRSLSSTRTTCCWN